MQVFIVIRSFVIWFGLLSQAKIKGIVKQNGDKFIRFHNQFFLFVLFVLFCFFCFEKKKVASIMSTLFFIISYQAAAIRE
jgi:hypothetical protein